MTQVLRRIVLVEPAGPTEIGSILTRLGMRVELLDLREIDNAIDDPERLAPVFSTEDRDSASLVIAIPHLAPGGAAAVDWQTQVHGPLQRSFTSIRGVVPGMLRRPAGGNVVVVMPSTALFADPDRTAESVVGRCLFGLAEGLQAELLGSRVSVSIVLTGDGEKADSLARQVDAALADGGLYSLPASVVEADVIAAFDPWLEALASTSSDVALPPLGPMGEVYRAELRGLETEAGAAGLDDVTAPPGEEPHVAAKPSAAAKAPGVTLGSTALVTGGASGIGLGIAKALLGRGLNVVVADVREDHIANAMEQLAQFGERVMPRRLDVTDRSEWKQAAAAIVERFGAIDIVCLNAGIGILGTVLQSSQADWKWVMGVNLEGVTNGIESLLPIMRAQGSGGTVMATSSAGGLMVADDGGIYSTAKFGVVAIMDCLRAELASEGIGVTTLCPAGVNTNIHDHETMRPEEFRASGVRGSDGELENRQEIARAMLAHGTDPIIVGAKVLEAIDRNAPIVFTDGGIAPVIRLRRDAISASIA